jgi:hypothetical protein
MEMNFEKNILSQGQTLFTQDEFNRALGEAKAEIMAIAIQTSKQVIMIERQACAEVCKRLAEQVSEGEVSTALVNASIAIMNRMSSQIDD